MVDEITVYCAVCLRQDRFWFDVTPFYADFSLQWRRLLNGLIENATNTELKRRLVLAGESEVANAREVIVALVRKRDTLALQWLQEAFKPKRAARTKS